LYNDVPTLNVLSLIRKVLGGGTLTLSTSIAAFPTIEEKYDMDVVGLQLQRANFCMLLVLRDRTNNCVNIILFLYYSYSCRRIGNVLLGLVGCVCVCVCVCVC
jgi:hypothetical protein